MTSTLQSFSWRFGGPLADLPPLLAWSLLGAAGIAGALWIVLGYRRTLVSLTPRYRAVLSSLRLVLWLLLLIALAGPTRVHQTFAQKETRPLALVVDRSDSMTAADNRGARRADDALRRWRALAPAARKTFGEPRTFAFADEVVPLASPDSDARLKTGRTRVFGSLQHTLAQAPPGGWGAIVVLTDGIDTSGDEAVPALNDTVRSALAAGTPVFSLAGRNRFAGGEFLSLRDLTVPSQVPPRSKFTLELTLESFQPADRTVPLRLRVGNDWRPAESLALATGRRALTWSTEIAAGAPGSLPVELVVGEGASAVTTRAEVRIAPPDTTRILYYQGALDWGYRFLSDILRRDPAFALTPIFNLAPAGAARSRSVVPGSLPDLPASAAGLDSYDVVVLANASATQFDAARQAALTAWVRAGGVLLFLAPDDDATHGYAGTELERLLPVVFLGEGSDNTVDSATLAFRQRIEQLGGAHGDAEAAFASSAKRARTAPALAAFAWEPEAGGIIGTDTVSASPLFANYARVGGPKPGATVLARHPREKAADGQGAILLALQRYGRGQSAVLTSDALWRWKLNQPSTDRGAELFWQNLLSWLARERPRGPRFERTPLTAETGRELTLHVRGGRNPRVTARLDEQPPVSLPAAGAQGGTQLYRWTPPSPGVWLLTATDEDNRTARHWFAVSDAVPLGENSGLPPDETLLQELARRTGGAVLENTPPSVWLSSTRDTGTQLLRETRTPLWHGGLLLFVLLGVYATELLLRRRWQLL
ncbi:MAG: Threonine dehydrogenase [Rariglobus sp.]|jgi:hypothetical protein|nr:Threonine dehydrogenase [Rariglobus sp.]